MFLKKIYQSIKNISYLILIAILSLSLTGCFYSEEEKELAKQYEEQAKINAINYIKDKYGFEAEVISATAKVINGGLFPDYNLTGDVNLKLKVNNKEFYVCITGEEESIVGEDNYQQDEIEKDLIALIENKLNIKAYDYFIDYPNDYMNLSYNANLIEEYYTKDNLNEILKNIHRLELYYINIDYLNNLNINNILSDISNTNVSLINFKSTNDYKNFINERENENHGYQLASEERLIIYKDSSLIINKGEVNYYKYNKSNYNDEVFIYSKDLDSIEIKKSSLVIEKFKNEMYKHSYYEFEDKKIEQISDVYSIPQTLSSLYIYFPIYKNFKNINNNELFLAYQCFKNNEEYYYFDNANKGTYTTHYLFRENFSSCDSDKNINFTLLKVDE